MSTYIYSVINILLTDVISSIKSGDGPTGNGGSVDTSLSTNDLSNFTSSIVPADKRLKDEEPEIFSKLQLGPKGMSVHALCCMAFNDSQVLLC